MNVCVLLLLIMQNVATVTVKGAITSRFPQTSNKLSIVSNQPKQLMSHFAARVNNARDLP